MNGDLKSGWYWEIGVLMCLACVLFNGIARMRSALQNVDALIKGNCGRCGLPLRCDTGTIATVCLNVGRVATN
jgi:hypothetical protein